MTGGVETDYDRGIGFQTGGELGLVVAKHLSAEVAKRLSAKSEQRGGRQSGGERQRPGGLCALETPVSFSPIFGVEREPKAVLNLNCNV
jgi:hypothetical protein